jgi:hypothetical protein
MRSRKNCTQTAIKKKATKSTSFKSYRLSLRIQGVEEGTELQIKGLENLFNKIIFKKSQILGKT